MKDPTFDRRKYPRVHTESLVSIARLDSRDALAHAVDLSIGGIRFQCVGLHVEKGEILRISLTFEEETITLVGQVTRVVPLDDFTQELGLVFTKMDEATRTNLERLLPDSAEKDPEDERRGYRRVSYDSILHVARASLVDVAAQARDLSLGGLRFSVQDLDLELGDTLRVTLELDGESISVIGQIVRVTEADDSKQELALSFFEVDAATLEVLERALPFGEEV